MTDITRFVIKNAIDNLVIVVEEVMAEPELIDDAIAVGALGAILASNVQRVGESCAKGHPRHFRGLLWYSNFEYLDIARVAD